MGRLALVFPGQGSQTVGMGAALCDAFPEAAALYRRADEMLGWSLSELSFQGPAEKLSLTQNSQPALYVNSAAALAALQKNGLAADVVCGHSLGEYSALAAAGALSFEEGLRLVSRRGELMAQAAAEHPGAMAAVLGLQDAQVEEVCRQAGEVWPVNYNSTGQLVISGKPEAVEKAIGLASAAGAKKSVLLPVSGAFHSPLMAAAAEAMRPELAQARFQRPQTRFMSSISCDYEPAARLPELLAQQIVSPVRWRQTVEKLIDDGCDRFLEVGSGKVLTGLIRRIDRGVAALPFSEPAGLQQALAL